VCSITDALSIVGDRYALLVARELRYDAVITDLEMPRLDGFGLIPRLDDLVALRLEGVAQHRPEGVFVLDEKNPPAGASFTKGVPRD